MMVKIISDDSYKTHAFIDDIEISNKTTSVQFEQNAGEVPIFTFETIGFPNIEVDNANIRFRFTPETISDSVKVIRHTYEIDEDFRNAFVASIESAIRELPPKINRECATMRIADRIIGREK